MIDEEVGRARRLLLALPQPVENGRTPAEVVFELVDRLEAMLEHTTDMVSVLGPDGTIRYSNRAAGTLTGYSEVVNGASSVDFVHPDDAARVIGAFGRCIETEGATAEIEFRIRHADGSWHHVEASARNSLSDPVAGVVVSMHDVCSRKEAERALIEANESMREFLAVAAHELRTPTSVVDGFASSLARNWDRMTDVDRREAIDALARSSRRLTTVVEDLLTLSALDAGAPAAPPGATDLAAAVGDAVDEVDGVGVTVDVPSGIVVTAGRRELRRVLRNYLENAIRYGAPPVLVEATPERNAVVVRVRDHGEGVAPEFADRLFERFTRADTSRSRQTGGTGLGLSIVRALAEGWGGEAWFEPGPGLGACFAVRIPLARV